jgi:predicted DNA-binding ribbon-helix-helix protein
MVNLRKRSVNLKGHATSLALEPEFWAALEAMALAEGSSLAALIARLDAARGARSLASACRTAALAWALDRRSGGVLRETPGRDGLDQCWGAGARGLCLQRSVKVALFESGPAGDRI